MEIRTIDDNRKIVQECPFCGGLYCGTSGIVRHMKVCKKKLCAQCKRPKEKCYDIMKFWSVECGETFKDKS